MEKFIDFWNKYKKKFKEGKDYIGVDCGDYIAIAPTVFAVMNGIDFISHCVTKRQQVFNIFYNSFSLRPVNNYDGIKVFAFAKNKPLDDFYASGLNGKFTFKDVEFTFWLSKIYNKEYQYELFGLHDHTERMITSYFDMVQLKTRTFKWSYLATEEEYNKYKSIISKPYVDKLYSKFYETKKQLRRKTFNEIKKTLTYDFCSTIVKDFYEKTFEEYWESRG